MSVAPTPHRTPTSRRSPLSLPLTALLVAALAGGAVVVAAPAPARAWVAATVCVAWLGVAYTAGAATVMLRRRRSAKEAAYGELRLLRARSARLAAESAHLLDVVVPAVVKRLRGGATVEDTLTGTPRPKDARLRRLLEAFITEVGAAEHRARASAANRSVAERQLTLAADSVDRMTSVTLPAAVAHLRTGASAETVMAGLDRPADARLRVLLETTVRELAVSERRAAVAQGAGAETLGRVQAKAITMLADLREMQDRYGEEVFGDLLELDHNVSQLGFLTDRLALLMGGRASRVWNRPIPVESVLRGAVGRIAAYQRVRLHFSGKAAVAGFAAEGVMHLLAELMDNAANFSPPFDEVHVYVEERPAGLVITIEDCGPRMSGAAMSRAEEAVSGTVTDLATHQGTRLGLAVVGRLAVKYRMNVSFRPSSRGGTGVMVLLPPQLLAPPRGGHSTSTGRASPAHGITFPLSEVLTASGVGTAGTTPWEDTAAGIGTTAWDDMAGGAAGDASAAGISWDDPAAGAGTANSIPWDGTARSTAAGAGRGDTTSAEGTAATMSVAAARTAHPTSRNDTTAEAATPGTTAWDSPAETRPAAARTADTTSWNGTTATTSAVTVPAAGPVPGMPRGIRRVATPGGLPVRPAGRTMAAADRGREPGTGASESRAVPGRDAGTQFDAFQRSRRPLGSGSATAGSGPSASSEAPAYTATHPR